MQVVLTLIDLLKMSKSQRKPKPVQQAACLALQVSLSETLVWRAAEMVQRLDLASLSGAGNGEQTEAAADIPMQMSLVSISNLSSKVR